MSKKEGILKDHPVKRKILNAAIEVFAEKGFAGARMDEIALHAGINKAMLYYHIGHKEDLYSAVLLDVIGGAWKKISEKIEGGGTSEEKLAAITRGIAQAAKSTRHFPRLILREWAAGGVHLPKAVLEELAGIFQVVRGILEKGAREGSFRKVDPLMTHLCILASIMVLSAAEPIRQRFKSAGIKSMPQSKFPIDIAGHVAEIVLHGIKSKPAKKGK